MRILICGDRNWTDRDLILQVMEDLSDGSIEVPTLIHGAARGADSIAAECAEVLGWEIEAYPAQWEEYGRSAGPIRNRQMLKQDPDVVIAFHNNIEFSKGTKDMVSIANRAGVPTVVHSNPDRG